MEDDWLFGVGYGADLIGAIDETFGVHAKTRRELIGHSQGAVAYIMRAEYGIQWHQTVLSKIEAGQRVVKLREAYALANIYWIPLEDLVRGRRLDLHLEEARGLRPGHRVVVGTQPEGGTTYEVHLNDDDAVAAEAFGLLKEQWDRDAREMEARHGEHQAEA